MFTTLWLFNVAKESGPFIDDKHDDLSIKNGDFPVAMLNNQRLILLVGKSPLYPTKSH